MDEHRDTYHGNALLKAEAFFAWSGVPTLGDDSGLEALALDSRPGVLSARYAPSDQEKIERLLAELSLSKLASSPEIGRKALFRCVLTFVDGGPTPLTAEGVLTGKVLESPAGSGGFGYDPIISIDELDLCTLAEVDFEITCRSGFRAKAAECLFKQRSFVG